MRNVIKSIDHTSPLRHRAAPGDELLSINGNRIVDVLDYKFYAYDPDTFSCRVTMIHVLHRIGSADYRDYIDTTFYLRRVGEQYLMYDRLNH